MIDETLIAGKVRQAVAAALGGPIDPKRNLSQADEPRWDSLKHVEIMFMLEESFGITLDPEDFAAMTSIDSCVAGVIAHLDKGRSG